jgi:hypothetical protein
MGAAVVWATARAPLASANAAHSIDAAVRTWSGVRRMTILSTLSR